MHEYRSPERRMADTSFTEEDPIRRYPEPQPCRFNDPAVMIQYRPDYGSQQLRYYRGDPCCCEPDWAPAYKVVGSELYPTLPLASYGAIPGLPSGPARRREASESEEDVITTDDFRCSCDHLPNGSYRYLEEEGGQFPPDVTQNKQEVIFYPKAPVSTTTSVSTTSALQDYLSAKAGE